MPLIELWKTSPVSIEQYSCEQIVAMAGEGKLRDNSSCSEELRLYFSEIDTAKIRQYIHECLEESFPNSGMVLQDLVNELGRRLDYSVSNGRYKGKKDEIGYDGLWESSDTKDLVIEVKTTDTYRINLDTIAGYRTSLIRAGRINEKSAILLVVGRENTGELEAQARGSRHSWDIRLISTDSLVRLVQLKESTDEEETGRKIRELLTPIEYTKLDHLIDIVFTAAKDAEDAAGTVEVVKKTGKPTRRQIDRTDSETINSIRARCISALAQKHGVILIRRSRASYWNAEHTFRTVCTISKHYTSGDCDYWYAFHKRWLDFLGKGENSFYVLGFVDSDEAYAIPFSFINKHLDYINTTVKAEERRHYWHIKLRRDKSGEENLQLPKKKEWISLDNYRLEI